jgi:adenosylhomocysteine nucleosidase
MKTLKIGIVIADDMEYAPFADFGGESAPYFGRAGHKFSFSGSKGIIELHSVYCGIGKVNAAAATMHLIDNGCEMILNAGLSGGISGVARGELVAGDHFLEHDFDLTPLGFEKCVKPGQDYIYEADKTLLEYFKNLLSIKSGTLVTGDCFVSDSVLKAELTEKHSAAACDMETAAIASVCHIAGIPFFSVRRVSDDAGESAGSAYREMNENEKFDLAELLMRGVKEMCNCDKFFC